MRELPLGRGASRSLRQEGIQGLLAYLETELADRGMSDVAVTATGCMKVSIAGPRWSSILKIAGTVA